MEREIPGVLFLQLRIMDQVQITKVGERDLYVLQDIARQTFLEAFAAGNSEENMNQYLDTAFSLQALESELRNPHSFFYFAKLGDQVIGYLKVNTGPAQTELQDQNSLEIERIYLLQSYLGKRVGQLLYEKAVEIAVANKVSFIWLGVWEKNLHAIGFYKRNGFEEFDRHLFIVGNDPQTDIMMKKPLI